MKSENTLKTQRTKVFPDKSQKVDQSIITLERDDDDDNESTVKRNKTPPQSLLQVPTPAPAPSSCSAGAHQYIQPLAVRSEVETQKPSRLSLFVRRSIAVLSIAANAVFRQQEDGCVLRGCQCFIWFNIILLLVGALWTCFIWTDLMLGITGQKYWTKEFSPEWPFFSSMYTLSICWVLPLTCAILLIISTFICKRRLARLYFIIIPWLLLLPIGFALHSTFFLGGLSPPRLEQIMQAHLTNYKEGEDSKNWDAIQYDVYRIFDLKFKCCGLHDNGWTEWVAVSISVPLSCCKVPEDLTDGCPVLPSDDNTWLDGCLYKLYRSFVTYGTLALLSLAWVVITISFSIFSATRYFAFLQRAEINPDYEFSTRRFCIECCCPCVVCCKKDPFPGSSDRQPDSNLRTTEIALLHRVERFGVPLSHVEEFKTQQAKLKQNNNSEEVITTITTITTRVPQQCH